MYGLTWEVGVATLLVVVVCVFLHYEVLSALANWLPRVHARPRRRIMLLIPCIMLVHVAQIWIYGLSYFFLLKDPSHGKLDGLEHLGLFDHVYYSAVVFTTLGFGDLIPSGAIRFMTGVEALTGLVFITWSASFAFLEMQRLWRP